MIDRRQRLDGGLAVYVTSHGFGHLNRTAAVLNRVPVDVPLLIRCHSNLFENWRERLKRTAELEHYVSDVGAINPPGDSAATDQAATLEQAARLHAAAMAQLDDQVSSLKDRRTSRRSLRRPGRSAGRSPPCRTARLSDEQFYVGRHLRSLCPGTRRRMDAVRRRPACVLSPRDCDLPCRARNAHGMVVASHRFGHDRQPGIQSSHRAPQALRFEKDRQTGLPLHRPLRSERSRLVAPGAIRSRSCPIRKLLSRARRKPLQSTRCPVARLAWGRSHRLV